MASKNLNGKLVDLIAELKCASYSAPSMGGMAYTIAPGSEDWDYCYRRIAYFTSSWEGIYITGIKHGVDISVLVEEDVV